MKGFIVALSVCLVFCFAVGASACPVATFSQFAQVDHCGVVVQAAPVYAVQAAAVPTVVYAQPVYAQAAIVQQNVVVQKNVNVRQRQRVVQQRQVIRTRTVIR